MHTTPQRPVPLSHPVSRYPLSPTSLLKIAKEAILRAAARRLRKSLGDQSGDFRHSQQPIVLRFFGHAGAYAAVADVEVAECGPRPAGGVAALANHLLQRVIRGARDGDHLVTRAQDACDRFREGAAC
eukprot:1186357-Prorocentrum_minimum.AAC.4